jgi:hypothetical protein
MRSLAAASSARVCLAHPHASHSPVLHVCALSTPSPDLPLTTNICLPAMPLFERSTLTPPPLSPPRYEIRLAQPGSDPRTCLGGSCMAFCPPASTHEEAGLLLVGTEGGRLLRCQVCASYHPHEPWPCQGY